MPSDSHHYFPLKPELREIRLLTLLSGDRDEPLKCRLSTASLAAGPSYIALSYVWAGPAGSASVSSSIDLDGHSFVVTPNLFSALQHIRPLAGNESIHLWVDAVSINQNNLEERSQQVAMMRDIYASAAQVTIWLGEEDKESDTTFDALLAIADEASWLWQSVNGRNDAQRRIILQHSGSFFLSLLSRRTWFSRVWVLQELAMARDDPVVVCGWKRSMWSTFVAAWQMMAKDTLAAWGTRRKVSDSASKDAEFDHKIEVLSMTKLDVLDNLRRNVRSQGGESLRRLLIISRTSEATDPRDRIYGLLGLLETDAQDPKLSVVIPIDYRKPCSEVYADAMAHIFSRGDGPDFLSGLFLPGISASSPHILSLPPSIGQPDLPSWVPDFSRQVPSKATQTSSMLFRPPSTMSASGVGQGAKNGKVLDNGRTLQVEGLMVDTINDIIPFGSSLDAVIDGLANLEAVTSKARQLPCLYDPAIALHMQRFRDSEPLWRILISNMHKKSGYEPAPASYQETYLSFLKRTGAAYIDHIAGKYSDDLDRPEFELSL